jgi:HlyD family secretion protein
MKKLLIGAALAGGGLLVIAGIAYYYGNLDGNRQKLVLHTVKRTELPIVVTERGNLESQDDVNVFCDVDDIEGDNFHGTPILSIVPNGQSVQQGELLVELDSSNHQERLDRQILGLEKARSEQIQARVKYENQSTQNETSAAEAKLKVDLAELALKQFEDEDGGTFQIDLQDLELQVQEAQAGKLIEETNLAGVEQLYKLGYRSSGEVAQARLSSLKAERQLATAISKRKELVEYQYKKSRLELEGQVASAKRTLEQVLRDNEALLAQAKAATDAADEAFKKEEERLKRYRDQVAKCKIYAPADGMVAYATESGNWRREEIREGANVRPRQRLISLPNLKKMQVKTAVHESVLDLIAPGLPTTVRVDAFPDRSYDGTVRSVAVLPDQDNWMSSDTKVYRTVVSIDQEVDQLKPGMTAVVEIHVADLHDIIAVPVQAIRQVRGESWCHVGADGSDRRKVVLGRTNEKFIEVTEGLREGEIVVLNPEALFDDAGALDLEPQPRRPRRSAPPSDAPAANEAGADGAAPQASVDRPGGRPGAGRDAPDGRPEGAGRGDGDGPRRSPSRGERGPRQPMVDSTAPGGDAIGNGGIDERGPGPRERGSGSRGPGERGSGSRKRSGG